jgi:hypothetical protein
MVPLVSVIIPTYNRAALVAEAVARRMLAVKCAIYAQGCEKRGNSPTPVITDN